MTLCVAAQCMDNKRDQVVVAFEFSMESGIATAEIEHRKLLWIGEEHFPVLIAGEHTRCQELTSHIEHAWYERDARCDFIAACRQGVKQYKHTLANEYISARLGISYDDFLGKRRISIPRDQYRDLLTDIERMKLGCDLLIVYFNPHESMLVRIEDKGALEVCSNFAAIGSGMYIAESVFFQRGHSRGETLAKSLYHVYEAMRLGAHAPGVGTQFTMGIVQFSEQMQNALWTFVEPGYLKVLEKEFQKFGPKKLRRQVIHREFLRKLYLLKPDRHRIKTKSASKQSASQTSKPEQLK